MIEVNLKPMPMPMPKPKPKERRKELVQKEFETKDRFSFFTFLREMCGVIL